MNPVSIKQYAELCHLTSEYIHTKCRNGKLNTIGGKLDLDDPVNALFLAREEAKLVRRGNDINENAVVEDCAKTIASRDSAIGFAPKMDDEVPSPVILKHLPVADRNYRRACNILESEAARFLPPEDACALAGVTINDFRSCPALSRAYLRGAARERHFWWRLAVAKLHGEETVQDQYGTPVTVTNELVAMAMGVLKIDKTANKPSSELLSGAVNPAEGEGGVRIEAVYVKPPPVQDSNRIAMTNDSPKGESAA